MNVRSSLGHIDQYELLRELGGGGFGCVYLARDRVSDVDVAVKGLPPLVRNNKDELENIRRNFALVSRLHHPNIAAALTLHPATDVVYNDQADADRLRVFKGDTLVVMQYAPGVTLSKWAKSFSDRMVPIDQAVAVTTAIARALDYAHAEKILHRDIKPENVMIDIGDDSRMTVRVLDFGLAAEIHSSMSRVSNDVSSTSGTRPYMAPEQWLGDAQGHETDQYSLAALFYELVTGKVPFASAFETGDPLVMFGAVSRKEVEVPSWLPRPVRQALGKALSKKRETRFASCTQFAEALRIGVKRKLTSTMAVSGLLLCVLAVAGAVLFRIYNGRIGGGTAAKSPVPAESSAVVRDARKKSVSAPVSVPVSRPAPAPKSTPVPRVAPVSAPGSVSAPAPKSLPEPPPPPVSVPRGAPVPAPGSVSAPTPKATPPPRAVSVPRGAPVPAPGSVSAPVPKATPAPRAVSVPESVPAPVPAPGSVSAPVPKATPAPRAVSVPESVPASIPAARSVQNGSARTSGLSERGRLPPQPPVRLPPELRIVAVFEGKEIKGAKIQTMNGTFDLPYKWEGSIAHRRHLGPYKVTCERGREYLTGEFKVEAIDWSGLKTIKVQMKRSDREAARGIQSWAF